jgi:hypothetical protein
MFDGEIDIKVNSKLRHVNVSPLRFAEDGRLEGEYNEVWDQWFYQGLGVRDIAALLGKPVDEIKNVLEICKKAYDEWLSENAVEIYGTDEQRLVDFVEDLEREIDAVDRAMFNCESVRDFKDMKKLKLDLMRELAKFKGITPAEKVDVRVGAAEVVREKLRELFD